MGIERITKQRKGQLLPMVDTGGEIAEKVKKSFCYLMQVVMHSENKKTGFKPTHKRWVVERTFSWFDNDRRLCRNYELLIETSENMAKLNAIKLLLYKI